MKIFGMTLFEKAAPARTALSVVSNTVGPSASGGFVGAIQEQAPGDWQKNIKPDDPKTVLTYGAIYACIDLIAQDVAKLPPKLTQLNERTKVWEEATNPAYTPVLRKPNHYQTRLQFLHEWVTCLLLTGNTFVLKERDESRKVRKMYVLDPRAVEVLVTPDGGVYYGLKIDTLAGVSTLDYVVPASEIIHDRMMTPWHPLIGVSPLYAAACSSTQGMRIQANSSKFFENMSRPSGQLTSPNTITEVTAQRLKEAFEKNYGGQNMGRLMVTGEGLKYEPMAVPAQEAQLIEQLRWTVQDVVRPFHIPLYMIDSTVTAPAANIAQLREDYYSKCLQSRIENIEQLLDEGLDLPWNIGVELDLNALLRMDAQSRAETNKVRLASGELAVNEARASENLPPVDGGDVPFMQQQMWPVDVLAKRDPPTAGGAALPPPTAGGDTSPANDQPPADGEPPADPPADTPPRSAPLEDEDEQAAQAAQAIAIAMIAKFYSAADSVVGP